jgi:hypothetical protein
MGKNFFLKYLIFKPFNKKMIEKLFIGKSIKIFFFFFQFHKKKKLFKKIFYFKKKEDIFISFFFSSLYRQSFIIILIYLGKKFSDVTQEKLCLKESGINFYLRNWRHIFFFLLKKKFMKKFLFFLGKVFLFGMILQIFFLFKISNFNFIEISNFQRSLFHYFFIMKLTEKKIKSNFFFHMKKIFLKNICKFIFIKKNLNESYKKIINNLIYDQKSEKKINIKNIKKFIFSKIIFCFQNKNNKRIEIEIIFFYFFIFFIYLKKINFIHCKFLYLMIFQNAFKNLKQNLFNFLINFLNCNLIFSKHFFFFNLYESSVFQKHFYKILQKHPFIYFYIPKKYSKIFFFFSNKYILNCDLKNFFFLFFYFKKLCPQFSQKKFLLKIFFFNLKIIGIKFFIFSCIKMKKKILKNFSKFFFLILNLK